MTQINSFDEFFKDKFKDLHEAILCDDLLARSYKKAIKDVWNYQQRKIDELERKLKDRKSKTIQAIDNKGMWVSDEYMIAVNHIEDIQND